MNPFDYSVPDDVDMALAGLNQPTQPTQPTQPAGTATAAKFIAGGTNLIDLMKESVMRPVALVDINRLAFASVTDGADGGLKLGALMRNADTAAHPLVRQRYPLLRAAILAGASPQIRNMASNGGNLLQRTRCVYFYDAGVPCNKHTPGSGCPAIAGLARQHAIFGTSEQCIATHPSDMCVALAALEATVHVRSSAGERSIPFAEFHRLPGDRPDLDTTLAADELITHIELPAAPQFTAHSTYLKLRDRSSYAFALVSVAAALDIAEDGTVRAARLALGGVAHRPWRNRDAEALLVGRAANTDAFRVAADRVMADARVYGDPGDPDGPNAPEGGSGNHYKIPMAHRAIVRALEMATASITTNTGEDAARLRGATA